ncbi:MAG: MBL fold metallo-hydrolase [Anaerolineae bacterium]|nr:MAG: MBL fold metallo-hydrolase [Anaerolineae bacterium]
MLETATCGPITRLRLARTVLGRTLYTVNAYLVDGLLVDTGPPATAGELVAWCRGRDVGQVVNTHHHEDHSGGNWALQRRLGLPIVASSQAVPILADFCRLELYRRVVWGQPRNVVAEPLGDIVKTKGYCFEVIPTPGHSPDHICLFEREQGWLFSGDLFVHERVRYARPEEDLAGTLASLRRVLALRPRLLICSHAGFVEDAGRAIERKIAYWEGLAGQARALRGQGLSPREITDRLLGPEGLGTRLTQGHSAKINLIRGLLEGGPGTGKPW